MNKPYILYHGNCFDGYGAAFAAWKKFGSNAVYIPCVYGATTPLVPKGVEVFMIDFSLKRDEMLKLHENCNGKLTVLDHHKTAEENLKGLDFAYFDMNRSGAMMAWDFFHGTEAPELIKYIQDRDLWKHELPFSKEVSAALQSYPYEFAVWDTLQVPTLIEEGKTLLRYQEVLVDMICAKAFKANLGGHEIMVVNSTSHWSEVGNKLCKMFPDAPFCASFFVDSATGNQKYSLRSIGDFDVSVIAKQYGGGGHKNAAGFEVKFD
jgi:oligoribonuclease NrnB/cAMP/cGMP phosphodiesterase (DHH superfamily)